MDTSELRTQRHGSGTTVIELIGEHDLATAEELRDAIDSALAQHDGLLVDLTETTFLDSTVINALFRAQRALTARERQLVLQIDGSGIVLRSLEITGLFTEVAVAHERDEAVAMAASGPGAASA
jgi:anti-sigma B factor antagonist